MNWPLFRVTFNGDPGSFVQIWLLPPFVTVQPNPRSTGAMPAWMREHTSRLEFSPDPPFARVVHIPRRNQLHPVELLERSHKWEGWPGAGWVEVGKNWRILQLQRLSERDYAGLRESLLRELERHLITLALLAGIEAAALAVLGIATAHWLTPAFFVAGTALAVCGVINGHVTSGIFEIFFQEDISASPHDREHVYLTLDAFPRLCHQILGLYSTTRVAITGASILFLGGILTFIATVQFDDTTRPPRGASLIAFRVLTVLPSALYMVQYWRTFVHCSLMHRQFREEGKRRRSGAEVGDESRDTLR
ncbi:hypothetical protein DFH09DRAFT_1168265 [Mycena vulgaris]|nr:hypothetical protein DFH09DRAFT_1168265 [Mycena vulgaris]